MTQSLRQHKLEINGLQLHVAEQGAGPLVVLVHGWPELGYSWRHQLSALAAAGFRVVAPDLRGFGESEGPEDSDAYSVLHNAGDMVALVAALGETEAIIVGHDWGAPIAWTSAQLRPDVFRAVVGLSVPHRPRGPAAPMAMLSAAGLGRFYWFYFQTDAAATDFERDVDVTLRKLFYGISGDVPRDQANPLVIPEGHTMLDTLAVPPTLPSWLSEAELKHFVDTYARTGFRKSLYLYRNLDRNWDLTAAWAGAKIVQPALYIAGSRDPVIAGERGEKARAAMRLSVPNLREVMIDGAGHWIQQERPTEVNAALLEFLRPFASR
jgi:pimeloyl-ACP methyl ester carboxylesterase